MNTIFILTGFKQKKNNAQFKWMKIFFTKLGYDIQLFAADWDYHVMSDYVTDFKDFYKKNKGKNNTVLGFSYGAMIALLSARDLRPDKLFLCSLSPYFKEDMPAIPAEWRKKMGVHRCNDFLNHDFKKTTKGLDVSTVILYGEAEGEKFPILKNRVLKTHKALSRSKLILVPEAPHQIDHAEYVRALKMLF